MGQYNQSSGNAWGMMCRTEVFPCLRGVCLGHLSDLDRIVQNQVHELVETLLRRWSDMLMIAPDGGGESTNPDLALDPD